MSILEQFERDLLAAARSRLPTDAPPARARRRDRRWTGVLVVTVSVAVAVAVVVLALGSLRLNHTTPAANPSTLGGAPTPALAKAYAPVAHLLFAIPQEGTQLGYTRARVTITLWADLESVVSRRLAQDLLPALINSRVRSGQVRLTFRALCTSSCAAADHSAFEQQQTAALAAGRQRQLWNYALLMFAEQGRAGTHYVDPGYLMRIAKQIPTLHLATWQRDRRLASLRRALTFDAHAAHANNVFSTPTMSIRGTKGRPQRIIGVPTLAELTRAIQQAH